MIKLNTEEKEILVKRRHIFVLYLKLTPFVFIAFIIFLSLIASFFIFKKEMEWINTVYEYVGDFSISFFVWFLVLIIILLVWCFLFFKISSYYLDCWVITNQRTIHTELKGLFSRYISSIYHHQIQDVSVDVKGLIPTYFNYGDLQIQTAGKFRQFVFKQIETPYKTKDILMDTQREYLKKKRSERFDY